MKTGQLLQLAFIAVAAAAVFFFVHVAQDSEGRRACVPLCALHPAYAGEDRLAPDFELPDLAGRKVRLADYRGKIVVLNFWTRTCQPCLEEMPALADLAKILKGRSDVALVTITTDESAEIAKQTLQAVLRSGDPPFPVLVDAESAVVAGKFGTRLFPETWVIDADGVIRARFDGARDWSNAMVLDLLRSIAHPASCGAVIHGGRPVPGSPVTCGDGDGEG